ncbi:MAG TPA: thioredoxin domain-containing protein, partial [Smithellaceae bacterium]|nr:thioredoxin domain-containing protein [Smithellaceae bacterium]
MDRAAFIKKYRNPLTIILSLAGIGLMAYYDYCDTACSYLKGDIWGIDLKYIGIIYMTALIIFAAFRQTPFVRIILAGGLGVEVYLVAFQVQHDVFCPFCLAFAVLVIAAFLVNYEVPSAWREKRRRMWLYFLGEVDLTMLKLEKLPLLVFSLLAYLFIFFTFSGAVTPAYATENSTIPSCGKGPYEVILFSDYFCPPCRRIDLKAESLLKELLATGKVKIRFVDVPFNRATPMYAKHYLYAANANADFANILHVRKTLFEAAQGKRIQTEEALNNYLTEQKITGKAFDQKPVFR